MKFRIQEPKFGLVSWKFLVAISCLGLLFYSNSFATELLSNLRFSHKLHINKGIICEFCHKTVSTVASDPEALISGENSGGWIPLKKSKPENASASASQQVSEEGNPFGRPPMALCFGCHKSKKARDCALCHLERPGPTKRNRKRLPSSVVFRHESHKVPDGCIKCHSNLVEWQDLDEIQNENSMADCLNCHNGIKIKRNCNLCHPKIPRPKDHPKDYALKHGIPYRIDPRKCQLCHDDSSCVRCHTQKPKSHTIAWVRRRHGIAAQNDPDRCAACHASREVCQRCHKR